MENIFNEKKDKEGEEGFLKYLLENYPYEGYKAEKNIIEKFKENRDKTITLLRKKYNKYDNPSSTLGKGDGLTKKKGIILTHINSLIA